MCNEKESGACLEPIEACAAKSINSSAIRGAVTQRSFR